MAIREELDYLLKQLDDDAVASLSFTGGMEEIASQTAIETEIPLKQLRGRSKRKEIVTARRLAVYRIHETGQYSLTQIGAYFGRDHTTIMHYLKRFALSEDGAIMEKQRATRKDEPAV